MASDSARGGNITRNVQDIAHYLIESINHSSASSRGQSVSIVLAGEKRRLMDVVFGANLQAVDLAWAPFISIKQDFCQRATFKA